MPGYGVLMKHNMSELELGLKFDIGKDRFDLIEPEFEEGMAKILTFGAEKYAPNSWQHVENPRDRYYAALRRHLSAWRLGEQKDPESGMHHLLHVACNCMFLIHFDKELEKNK